MRALRRALTVGLALGLLGPAAARPAEERGKDGFSLQSEDGSFKLKLSGYLQVDGRFYLGDDANAGVDTFVLRRARPIVSGTVGQYFDFNITPDFGGGSATLQDAFLDARFRPAFRVKLGRFKAPVGLERLQSGAVLTFIERGLPTGLVPNRDLGFQLHGEIGRGVVSYQVGIFDGAPDGGSADTDSSDGKDLEGRLFFQPFRNGASAALKGLGIGVAGTSGTQLGSVPSYKTVGQLTFFSYAPSVTADGRRTRGTPQASYQNGPLRLLAEWVSSRQGLRKGPAETLTATHRAWQGLASYVVSGETPAAGVVTPKRPFDPARGGWGAVELAARYGVLELDADVFALGYADPAKSARTARAWGVGITWYLTRNVKYVANYDHTRFEGGAAAGAPREAENALLLRAQVSF